MNDDQNKNTTEEQTQQPFEPITAKDMATPALFGALALLMAALTAVLPGLFPLTAIFGSAFFAVMMVYDPSVFFDKLLCVVFFIAALLLSKSLTAATLLLGVFMPGGYALIRCIAKRRNVNSAVATQLLVYTVFVIVAFVFALLEFGEGFDVESFLKPFKEELKASFGATYDMLIGFPHPEGSFPVRETFVYNGYTLFVQMIPSVIGITVLAISSFSYWLTKSILTRRERKTPDLFKFMGTFDTFRVSRTAAVIYFISGLLTTLSTSGEELMLFTTIYTILSVVFCYEGISLALFAMKMYCVNRFFRTLACILLTGLSVFGLSSLISIIGVFDCLSHIRQYIKPSARYT